MSQITPLGRIQGLGRLLVAGPLVTGLLVLAPPAQALPVFTESALFSGSLGSSVGPGSCETTDDPTPPQDDIPVAENGAPGTASSSNVGTLTNELDATDLVTFATSSTNTARVTSAGGNPGVIEMTMTGNVESSTTKPTSACDLYATSGAFLEFAFTVAQGGFMTFTAKTSRHSYGAISIRDGDGRATFGTDGYGLKFSGVTSVYLPPGSYLGYVMLDAYLVGPTAVPSTPVAGSIQGRFAVAGSQAEPVSGAGQRYLSFPASRSCATDSVDAAITGKGKRAKRIRKVTLFVNDTRVRTVRHPSKSQPVTLPVADEADADVLARVILKPTKPGHKPKVREVEVGYIACS